jgi:hypothetical protein
LGLDGLPVERAQHDQHEKPRQRRKNEHVLDLPDRLWGRTPQPFGLDHFGEKAQGFSTRCSGHHPFGQVSLPDQQVSQANSFSARDHKCASTPSNVHIIASLSGLHAKRDRTRLRGCAVLSVCRQ